VAATSVGGASVGVWQGGASPYLISSKKLGMWLFIISDSLTFGALLAAYAYLRVASEQWPTPFEIYPSIFVATVMTFCLLTSSITMVFAVLNAKKGNVKGTMRWLGFTMLGGVAFVILHANEWRGLIEEGLRPFTNPWGTPPGSTPLFGAAFMTCTGLHMLHVTIGVIVLANVARGFKKGTYTADHVEISGLYWHFVDLVWMFIFPLLYLMSVNRAG
jgi:cytochrome c oxidase subunit III